MVRSRLLACLVAAGLLAGAPLRAQEMNLPEPPRTLKKPPAKGKADLDKLFGLLKRAPDKDAAKLVEARIWGQLFHSGSDTTDLLMTRARTAMDANEHDLAIELLDKVIEIRPDYVEGWNRRGTLHYVKKDYGAAIADFAETLAREPRHFGALVGLGMILKDMDQDRRALDAFRQALDIHPHLDRVPEMVKQLAPKVEGRDI